MLRRFLLGIMVVSIASVAWAGIPFPANCSVWVGEGTVQDPNTVGAYVRVVPSGLGDRLDEARIPGSATRIDATINVILRDAANNPVALYPFADLLLVIDGLALCAGQDLTPDGGSTDQDGYTFWNGGMFAGGQNSGDMFISVSGELLPTPIELNCTSPDINGSLAVNLTDLGILAPAFNNPGAYNAAADLDLDGDVDLSDLGILAPFFNVAVCP